MGRKDPDMTWIYGYMDNAELVGLGRGEEGIDEVRLGDGCEYTRGGL